MKYGNYLLDKKVNGASVTLVMTISEYWSVSDKILEKNEFQRRKVRTGQNIYKLLQDDLVAGCIMPPIVLATSEEFRHQYSEEFGRVNKIIQNIEPSSSDSTLIKNLARKAMKSNKLLILDGLQRTHTIRKALDETTGDTRGKLLDNKIRVELYLGLTKYGLLYRMLTLNSGQTPMTFRHQLEILFYDYLPKDSIPNITLHIESKDSFIDEIGNYIFADVIDLYQSYLLGSPQKFTKKRLLQEIKELEFLESYERKKSPDMRTLIIIYDKLVRKWNTVISEKFWDPSDEEDKKIPRPFGDSIWSIFNRSQSMSGFGSACNLLLKREDYDDLEHIQNSIDEGFNYSEDDLTKGMRTMVTFLEEIRSESKRIGTDQRKFFDIFFEVLLYPGKKQSFTQVILEAYEQF